MINAIRDIGEYASKKYKRSKLETIIQNPNEKNNCNRVIKIIFEKDESGEIVYKKIDQEEFTIKNLTKYLYKKGTSKGADKTPTSKLTEANKTLNNKIKLSILYALNNYENNEKFTDEYKELREVYEIINSKNDIIINDINKMDDTKEGKLLTCIINNKYIGDYDIFNDYIMNEGYSSFYNKFNIESKEKNKKCYVCGKKNTVYGFVNTFNFYTVDKPGMVTGGFDQKYAWKNYPVCPNCASTLELGKSYIKKNLSDYFAGFSFFVIPKFIFRDSENKEIFDILEELESKLKLSFKDKNRKTLTNSQNDMFEVMEEMKNYLNYNMLFYKEEQSGNVFRILLYIEDVLPSRIKLIFDIKDKVEDHKIFKKLKGKDGTFDLKFNFELIRNNFFPNNKFDGNWDKNFLEILNSIFTNKKVDYQYLIYRFIYKLQKDGRDRERDYSTYWSSIYSLLVFKFFLRLDLLKNKNKKEEKSLIKKNDDNEKYLVFFEEHNDVFDTDTKKASFLIGVLTQNLFNLPEQENKPFYARLNGLSVDEKILKRIFVEVQNKLNEYKKNYYSKLETLIAEYLTCANLKTITRNEISYYFVLGMNLNKNFKNIKTEEKK
ncbi:MAG: TIGR02556 family CRISPR-associated protein [Spirochaetes bacterium]|nr:TIGR02556 family CRISPR-associated protein [Spirochaetota bacterium]